MVCKARCAFRSFRRRLAFISRQPLGDEHGVNAISIEDGVIWEPSNVLCKP
jgi:hypothetical protein